MEYTMLVSSIEFDIESCKSASMLAIMKTVQSLYFLGKITKMVADQSAVKSLTKKPMITYSWKKSFKTVKEHMLLSLIAFEA